MLTRPAQPAPENPEPEDRLQRLFWNRAAVKKDLASLRDERDRLQGRLRQQEGDILRLQQRLEQLEGFLSDPERAANAAVFYQLRSVWTHCRRRLGRLARELAEHQRGAEHIAVSRQFEAMHAAELQAIDARIETVRHRADGLRQELRALLSATSGRGLIRRFRRRAARSREASLRGALRAAREQLEMLAQSRKETLARRPPEFQGLSLAGRRRINLAVIALAQELLLHFSADDIAVLAREASARHLTDAAYGTESFCRQFNGVIAARLRSLEAMPDLAARVRRRSRYLRAHAHYRNDQDIVPSAACCSFIPRQLDDEGRPAGSESLAVNVLAEEFWEVYSMLLS
jgi:hypothetical protein